MRKLLKKFINKKRGGLLLLFFAGLVALRPPWFIKLCDGGRRVLGWIENWTKRDQGYWGDVRWQENDRPSVRTLTNQIRSHEIWIIIINWKLHSRLTTWPEEYRAVPVAYSLLAWPVTGSGLEHWLTIKAWCWCQPQAKNFYSARGQQGQKSQNKRCRLLSRIFCLAFHTMLSADSRGLVHYIWTVRVVVFGIKPVGLILWAALIIWQWSIDLYIIWFQNMWWAWLPYVWITQRPWVWHVTRLLRTLICAVPFLLWSIGPSTTCFFRFILIIYSILRFSYLTVFFKISLYDWNWTRLYANGFKIETE